MTRNRHRNSRVAHVLIKSTRQVRCVVVWSRHSSEEKSTAANTWEWVGTGYILARRPARRAGYALAKRSVWQMIWERAVLWLAPDRYRQRAAAPGACGQCPECGVCCNPFVNALHEWTDEEVSDMFLQWQLLSVHSDICAFVDDAASSYHCDADVRKCIWFFTRQYATYTYIHKCTYLLIYTYWCICISVPLCMRMYKYFNDNHIHIYLYVYIERQGKWWPWAYIFSGTRTPMLACPPT